MGCGSIGIMEIILCSSSLVKLVYHYHNGCCGSLALNNPMIGLPESFEAILNVKCKFKTAKKLGTITIN